MSPSLYPIRSLYPAELKTREMSTVSGGIPKIPETTTTTTTPHVTHVTHVTHAPQESNFKFAVNKFGDFIKFIFYACVGLTLVTMIFCIIFISNAMIITDDSVEINMFGNHIKLNR